MVSQGQWMNMLSMAKERITYMLSMDIETIKYGYNWEGMKSGMG